MKKLIAKKQWRVQTQVRAGFPCKVSTPANRACQGRCREKFPIKLQDPDSFWGCVRECGEQYPGVMRECEE